MIKELTGTGCPVFLSLWDQGNVLYDPAREEDRWYNLLDVNGGQLDVPDYDGDDTPGNWKYPLTGLRARILTDSE